MVPLPASLLIEISQCNNSKTFGVLPQQFTGLADNSAYHLLESALGRTSRDTCSTSRLRTAGELVATFARLGRLGRNSRKRDSDQQAATLSCPTSQG